MWPRLWSHVGLWSSWLGALFLPLCALLYLWMRSRSQDEETALDESQAREPFDIVSGMTLRQPFQSLAQVMIYIGLTLHWPRMSEQLPLTIAQVLFAFLIDISWVWVRGYRSYRMSISPTPIVLSINLFLWFKDEVFYWQWLLILIAIISRSLLSWERSRFAQESPRRVNIFNPSALVISLAGIALILTQSTHLTWGEEIAVQHGADLNAYWVIFAAGLLAQCFAPIGWVTLGGVVGYLVLDALYFSQYGAYRFIDTAIPPAVFLGLNLLITDPMTIPRARRGQIVYGLAYALLSFLCFGALKAMSVPAVGSAPSFNPTFLDKALAIPLLNLSARSVDRVFKPPRELIGGRLPHKAFWAIGWGLTFIYLVAPRLEEHPGHQLSFWTDSCGQALEGMKPSEPPEVCRVRDQLFSLGCQRGRGRLCNLLAESPLTPRAEVLMLKERACELGVVSRCNELGMRSYDAALALRGRRGLEDLEVQSQVSQAESLWRHACPSLESLKSRSNQEQSELKARGEACFHLANLYATPWRGQPNHERAFTYLRWSCYVEITEACQALTHLNITPLPKQ